MISASVTVEPGGSVSRRRLPSCSSPERKYIRSVRPAAIHRIHADDVRQFTGAWYREVLRTQRVNLLGASPDPDRQTEAEVEALAEAAERADLLGKALAANEGLARIARTPLILSLITLVRYHRYAGLPKGRTKLYQQSLESLLEQWDLEDKRLAGPAGPSLNEKLARVGDTVLVWQRRRERPRVQPILVAVVLSSADPRSLTPTGAPLVAAHGLRDRRASVRQTVPCSPQI